MPDLTSARALPLVAGSEEVQLAPAALRYVLRGADAVRAAAEAAFAVPIPTLPCRAGTAGERAALWLGPDEWLLIAPLPQHRDIERALGAALQGLPHSLVEVSQRQCALSVSGPLATTLLGAGCPLDLDASAFPVGMCTRTMLAKAEVVLWRTAEQAFHVEVWRSFAPYVSQFLAEAARGSI